LHKCGAQSIGDHSGYALVDGTAYPTVGRTQIKDILSIKGENLCLLYRFGGRCGHVGGDYRRPANSLEIGSRRKLPLGKRAQFQHQGYQTIFNDSYFVQYGILSVDDGPWFKYLHSAHFGHHFKVLIG